MMSPKAIAALVLEMKVPHEIQNDYCRIKWMLEQAAELAALSVLGMKYKEFTYNRRDW